MQSLDVTPNVGTLRKSESSVTKPLRELPKAIDTDVSKG